MRDILAIVLISISCAVTSSAQFIINPYAFSGGGGGGFTGDLVDENCEGTGTPTTPLAWVDGAGTPNWDYTTPPTSPQGGEWLQINNSDSTSVTHTTSATCNYHFIVHFTTLPSSESTLIYIQEPGLAVISRIRIDSSGNIGIRTGATTAFCTDTITTGVNYHFWLTTVSSGTHTLGFSTDGTRPTSGTKYITQSGPSGSASKLTIVAAGGSVKYVDRIIANTTTIPDSP